MCKPEIVYDCIHLGRRTMNSDEAAIANNVTQICNKIFVQVDDQQYGIGAHAVQYGLAESTNARTIFNKQFGIVPIDWR